MNFSDKFAFQDWLCDILHDAIPNVDSIESRSNQTTGKCEISLDLDNDHTIKLSITMGETN
jgi:hypothetical protein